jgi:clan AA aspartic protease (TIGR02281 family)
MHRWATLAVGTIIGQWLAFGGAPSPAAVHDLGMTAFAQHDYAQALRHWSHAVALQPDNPSFHYLRARALAHLGQPHSAADAYRLALLLDPTADVSRLAQQGLAELRTERNAPDAETVVSLEPDRGVWVVPVTINGKHRARFLLDTGASVTLISPAMAQTAGIRPGADALELSTLGGPTAGPPAVAASLRIGTADVENVHVVIHDPGPGLDGILGNTFLGRYNVSIDADQRQLRLRAFALAPRP